MFKTGIVCCLFLFSCSKNYDENTSNIKKELLVCKTSKDCMNIPKRLTCCSGCGLSPEYFNPINVKGYYDLKGKHSEYCKDKYKNCPTLNCPLIRTCKKLIPYCENKQCKLKIKKTNNCKPTK